MKWIAFSYYLRGIFRNLIHKYQSDKRKFGSFDEDKWERGSQLNVTIEGQTIRQEVRRIQKKDYNNLDDASSNLLYTRSSAKF